MRITLEVLEPTGPVREALRRALDGDEEITITLEGVPQYVWCRVDGVEALPADLPTRTIVV